MLYYPTLFYAILYYPTLCYAMLYYPTLFYAILYYPMLCYAILSYPMLCYAMLCYTILSYPMLCYTILYWVYAILDNIWQYHVQQEEELVPVTLTRKESAPPRTQRYPRPPQTCMFHIFHVNKDMRDMPLYDTIWLYVQAGTPLTVNLIWWPFHGIHWHHRALEIRPSILQYTPYAALMALDHLLHHTSSTGISAGQLGMRIVQGPQTADLGLLPCLAKKKKTDKTSTLGDFIWLNNLPSESKLMMCRHLSNWFKLLDTVLLSPP